MGKLFVLMGVICVLSIAPVFANDIILELDTAKTFRFQFNDGSEDVFIEAVFKDIPKAQVFLRDDVQETEDSVDFESKEKFFTYALSEHGTFKFLNKDDRLIIQKYDKKTGMSTTVEMPDKVAGRILSFLLMNTQDMSLDCCAFCEKIKGKVLFKQLKKSSNRLKFFKKIDDKTSLKPGDVVAFFEKNGEKFDIAHWALVIDKDLLMSKFGKAGPLFVHDKKSGLKAYNSEFICLFDSFDE